MELGWELRLAVLGKGLEWGVGDCKAHDLHLERCGNSVNGMSRHQGRLLALCKVTALFPVPGLVFGHGLHEELWDLDQVKVHLRVHGIDLVKLDARDTAQRKGHLEACGMINNLPGHHSCGRTVETAEVCVGGRHTSPGSNCQVVAVESGHRWNLGCTRNQASIVQQFG